MAGYAADESRWEALKESLRTLYLVENRELTEVQREMSTNHGFVASKSQYETHFHKWGFRKNLARWEWAAVVHKVVKRKRNSKDSEVCIDGLPMSRKKVRKAVS